MLALRRAAARPTIDRLQPLAAYLRLELRRGFRNRRYLGMTVAVPVVIYVLYTAVLPADSGGATVDGLTWAFLFLVPMAAYGARGAAMSQAAPVETERPTGWIRQLR